MTFLVPLGLIALIAILVLILIYILRPTFQEKIISSSYIWKLSLKYKRNKLPWQWVQRSLLFILQVLILTSIALMLAKPALVIANANLEKIIILDASASMQAESGGKTRFERAIGEITSLANNKLEEQRISVILADNNPRVIVRRTDSVNYIIEEIRNLECTFFEADMEKALLLANEIQDENLNSDVILYSDHTYQDTGYVQLKNMSNGEYNASIMQLTAEYEKGYYSVKADIASFGKASNFTARLYINGGYRTMKDFSLNKDEVLLGVEIDKVAKYEEINLILTDGLGNDLKDAFVYDNEVGIYGGVQTQYNVQWVNNELTPSNFVPRVFVNSRYKFTPVTRDSYTNILDNQATEGQDLYIYEGSDTIPTVLPTDGAIFIINPTEQLPESLGLSYLETRDYYEPHPDTGEMVLWEQPLIGSNTKTAAYNALTQHINPGQITCTRAAIFDYIDDSWEVILQLDDVPIYMTRTIGRQKVMLLATDLHYTNLPAILDWAMMAYNIYDYAKTPTVDKYNFVAGATITVNAKPNATSLKIAKEKSSEEPIAIAPSDLPNSFVANKIGSFVATQYIVEGSSEKEASSSKYFVRLARNECYFTQVGATITTETEYNSLTGVRDESQIDYKELVVYIAAALLLLLVIEWGLQYREQY